MQTGLMQTGLMVEPQMGGTYDELVDLAQWAETTGFDCFARSDHYMNMATSAPVTDAMTSIGGLALSTDAIKLAVLVTPLTFRHPAVIAKTVSTLDEMSHGRFELGIGTGWMEGEHAGFGIDLPPLGNRFDRFEESLGYLWAAFGKTTTGFRGEHFTLDESIDVLPAVGTRVPIIIGGSGMKRTPTLAGRFADEYNMFTTDLDTLKKRLDVMRSAATDAGRNPDDILVSIAMSPVIAPTDGEYQQLMARNAATRDMSVDEYKDVLDGRNIPHGTRDHITAAVRAYADAGVGRIYLQQFAALASIDRDRVALALDAVNMA